MPRVDTNNPDTQRILAWKDVDYREYVEAPCDICSNCYTYFQFQDDVEHPDYVDAPEGEEYRCAICGQELDDYDN